MSSATVKPSMHPRFVAKVCHLFFAGFSKKRKQTIVEVDLTFCTEAKKKKQKKKTEIKARINRSRRSGRKPWASAREIGETVLNNVANSESGSREGR